MEKTRLYEVRVDECCDESFSGGNCRIATVVVRSKSANEAIKKVLEKAKSEIEVDGIFVSSIKCLGELQL